MSNEQPPEAKAAEEPKEPRFVHFVLPRGISSEEAAKAIQDMVKRHDK